MNYMSFQSGTLVKRATAKGFTWTLRYYKDGQYKAMKIGTSDELPTEKAALAKAATMTAVINDASPAKTFAQLVEKYKADEMPSRPQTAASYNTALKHLEGKYASVKLEAMLKDLMAIQTWIGDLKSFPTATKPARPLSKKTKQNIKAVLHRLIECAMKWGYLPVQRNSVGLVEVKVKGIQPQKRLKKPLTLDQLNTLMNYPALSEHVRVMVKLCACLGLRISEVLGLRWEDIDLDAANGPVINIMRGAVGNHIDETKSTTSNAQLPIHPYIAETLAAWKAHSPVIEGWVFGSEATGRPFHRDSLQSDHLLPAGKACGIVDIGWHTFRHTYRKLMLQNGVDPETQMLLMRHADLRTTTGYGVDDEMLDVKRPANKAVVERILHSKQATVANE